MQINKKLREKLQYYYPRVLNFVLGALGLIEMVLLVEKLIFTLIKRPYSNSQNTIVYPFFVQAHSFLATERSKFWPQSRATGLNSS